MVIMQGDDLNIDDLQTFQTMIDELVKVWGMSICIWFFCVGKRGSWNREKKRKGEMYGIFVPMPGSMDSCLRSLCEKGGAYRQKLRSCFHKGLFEKYKHRKCYFSVYSDNMQFSMRERTIISIFSRNRMASAQ